MFEEPAGGWSLALGKAKLTWSADATTVTKTALPHLVIAHWAHLLGTPRQAALNELRVNRLLHHLPPPVPVPALVRSSRREPSMTFEAVDGVPLGPKFPSSLAGAEVDELVAMALAMDHYRPRRRWFRRLRVDSRLRLHQRSGLLSGADAQALDRLARSPSIKWHFAHGDITARNVLRDRDGHSVLIDWEWAGLYPAGYELAFLWSSLVNIPSGRAHLNAAISARYEAGFLLSATMVHLLHLQMWRARPHPLAASFEQTLAELLSAVRGRRMGR
jgi:Ser/Thr protein kinase RdoA (MazF antagonist)